MSPIYDSRSLEFVSHSPEQTRRLGVRLGELLRGGEVVCLSGDLGAGKTTLVSGIARGWGALEPATSPSYVLQHEYRRPDGAVLVHLDAYRLDGPDDARRLGFDEVLGVAAAGIAQDGAESTDLSPVVVEWPERLTELLPSERLWVSMSWADESKRSLRFEANGKRYEKLLARFKKIAFGK